MNSALHLKYRPQTLTALVGQPMIQTCLTNAIVSNQIAPAYLFIGARGTGKTSTARILAKSLNCLNRAQPAVTPCGTCESCRSIETSSSLDVNEIDAASNGGVDDARELVRTVGFAPIQGRYRIIIIDECHNLTKPAQDALLKCIEEPPSHIVFILCTTEAHKVLATITSRCQVYTFQAIAIKTIKHYLTTITEQEQIAIADEGLTAIARLCTGGLRDALQLLSKASLLGTIGSKVSANQIYDLAGTINQVQLLGILQAIQQRDVSELLQSARQLIDDGKAPKALHTTLLNAYRDLLILSYAPDQVELLTSPITAHTLKSLVAAWQPEAVQQGLNVLHEAEQQLRLSYNEQTWLEVCLLNLVSAFKSATVIKQNQTPQFSTNGREPIDPQALWEDVIAAASDKTKALLQHAVLTAFDGKTGTLIVAPIKAEMFKRNTDKVARMIQRVSGRDTPIKLRLQVPTSVN